MLSRLTRIRVRNYRSLADVTLETGPLNVLFGPNGAGKSSFLDIIWFVRDCAIRGVDLASSARSHGIGLLYDGAEEGEAITVSLATERAAYELRFALSSGRIEPFVGEQLRSIARDTVLIDRKPGSDKAAFYNAGLQHSVGVPLREPEKLSLGRYLDFDARWDEAADMDRLLRYVHFHHARSFFLYRMKTQGSEASHETWLWERGDNVWSVLRNLQGQQSRDSRYDTIMEFMSESFPSFDGLLLEPTGPTTVYGSFLEKGRRQPIRASGVSDGHLQMLLLLTILFGEGEDRPSVMLLDEPEVSLHPWALSVLARAVTLATERWNKQVFIATHSPVLISQFKPEEILAVEVKEGRTQVRRVSEIEGIQDLLEDYAAGSLYMAEALAGQREKATDRAGS